MALAILKPALSEGPDLTLEAELGKNRYFRLELGTDETVSRHGAKQLESSSYQGPMQGPVPEASRGRVTVRIPGKLIDRKNRFVQLTSYREADGTGPAFSEVLPVWKPTSLPRGFSKTDFTPKHMNDRLPQARSKPFRYEREHDYATGMSFWSMLGQAAQAILPAIGKLTQKEGGEGKGKGIGATLGALAQDPDVMKSIMALFGSLGKGKKADEAKAEAKSLSYAHGTQNPYSGALWVQAVVPLIAEAVKSPEMWGGLNKFHQSSLDFIQEFFGGKLTDFSKFGQEDTGIIQQMLQQQAMEKMMALQQQAKAQSRSAAFSNQHLAASGLDFVRVDSVHLSLPGLERGLSTRLASITIQGTMPFRVPVSLQTPKPISRAQLKLCIKPIGHNRPLIERKTKLYHLHPGAIHEFVVSAEDLRQLLPGEEYHLTLRLIWPNRNGLRIGTSISRLVLVAGALSFERVLGSTGEVVPLNDVLKHRPFWHKIWAETFTRDRRSLSLDAKYYQTLDLEDERNGRLETVSKIEPVRGSRFGGKMKSGMEYSLETLNALLPQISNHPPLSEAELTALRNSDFAHRFTQVARTKVLFDEKPGTSFALWTYPEVEIHRIALQTTAATDANTGTVAEQQARIVHFPIPSRVHFIGTKLA